MNQKKKIIKKLSEMHFKNAPEGNISQQLGLEAINIFYKHVINSEYAKIFYSFKNNKLLYSLIIFTNYRKFNKKLKQSIIWLILLKLITFRLRFSVVFNIFAKILNEKKAFRKILINCHLGMFFSNKEFRPQSTLELIKAFNKMHTFIKNKHKNIWAVVNNDNIKALKFLEKLGYKIFFCANNEIYLNKKF